LVLIIFEKQITCYIGYEAVKILGNIMCPESLVLASRSYVLKGGNQVMNSTQINE